MNNEKDTSWETNRQDAQTHMQDKLDQWKLRIKSVQLMIEKAGLDTRTELHLALIELRKLESAGKTHLESIQNLAASAWDTTKTELTDDWNQVSGAFESIWDRIRKQIH